MPTNWRGDRSAELEGKCAREEADLAMNDDATLEEIEATLNHWRQLKGCGFMPEMEGYCGTTQRVLKRVERFVDERDLLVKKARGIVFLDGVFCQGTADFGPCDRTCYFFWREEWLEKVG